MPLTAWPTRLALVMACSFSLTTFAAAQAAAQTVQPPRDARLLITVVDPTGAVLQDATVTVVGLDADAKASAPPPGKTTDKGTFSASGLRPGQYSIQAEFPGFVLGLLRDVRVRTGDNKHVIVLQVKGLAETATVSTDARTVSSSRTGPAFGLSLTSEQIAALSDDPAELSRQLNDLAGPNAIFRVDSFEGAELPAKSQIKSIHITRDQFAAETAQPGSTFVDIITQAGSGIRRGGFGTNYQDSRMATKSPFTDTKAEFQNRGFNGNVGGPIARNIADYSINVNVNSSFSAPSLYANLPTGLRDDVLKLRSHSDNHNVSGTLNWAISRDQTLRLGFSEGRFKSENNGVGLYDLPERAFSNGSDNRSFRILEAGPLGRRSFINSRLNINWSGNESHSVTEAPTVIVQDQFTSGGAQNRGGTHQIDYNFASDIDYVRGINSWRAGVQMSGSTFRTNAETNYLGTYTFSSMDAYVAGTPALYMREIGDPSFHYSMLVAAVYLQDDVRVSKSLTLTPGLRYSLQTHISDWTGYEPRFGLTWSPRKSGTTTLRASTGIFHGFLPPFVYEQTLRYDGTHQRQFIVTNPAYPDPGTAGTVPLTNRYVLGDFHLNRNVRHSAGVDQVVTRRFRVSVLYNYIHQEGLPRGVNLNPILNGVRPDPLFANVIATVAEGQIRRHEVFTTFNLNLAPLGAGAAQRRFDWRRLTINGSLNSFRAQRNQAGPFTVPPSGTLETEWGPGPGDVPYILNLNVNSSQIRNLNIGFVVNARSGQVYSETTGLDDNHDGILNDRRPGVGLNSLRGDRFVTANFRLGYTINMGGIPPAAGQGVATPRYRVNLNLNVNNLFNRHNYSGYSGVMTSSNYMKPTAVQNPRSMSLGMNIGF